MYKVFLFTLIFYIYIIEDFCLFEVLREGQALVCTLNFVIGHTLPENGLQYS